MLSQSLDLDLNQKDTQAMIQHVTDFFNIIKQDTADVVDVTELKFYLHKANLHRTNPSLFKRVNELAKESDFKLQWDKS